MECEADEIAPTYISNFWSKKIGKGIFVAKIFLGSIFQSIECKLYVSFQIAHVLCAGQSIAQ